MSLVKCDLNKIQTPLRVILNHRTLLRAQATTRICQTHLYSHHRCLKGTNLKWLTNCLRECLQSWSLDTNNKCHSQHIKNFRMVSWQPKRLSMTKSCRILAQYASNCSYLLAISLTFCFHVVTLSAKLALTVWPNRKRCVLFVAASIIQWRQTSVSKTSSKWQMIRTKTTCLSCKRSVMKWQRTALLIREAPM